MSSDDDWIYLYFRYQDPNTWYRIAVHTGSSAQPTRQIQRRVGGVTSTLASDNYLPPNASASPSPVWRDSFTAAVRGNRIRLIHGGQDVLVAYDDNPILSGTIALGNNSQNAWYDDVIVEPLRAIGTVAVSHNGAILRSGSGTKVVSIPELEYLRQSITLARVPNQDWLTFSHYGSTVFDHTNALAAGRMTLGTEGEGGCAELRFGHLELSSTALNEYIPLAATAQRMSSAISKVFAAYTMVLDDMNNLVR